MREIPVGRSGLVALVDDEDYELVSRYRWWSDKHGPNLLYARQARPEFRLMHVVLMGTNTGIDHADHDGLNNQRSNLRPATRGQNAANSRKRDGLTSVYKGVSRCLHGRKRWQASIGGSASVRRSLGRFVSEEDAARAYDVAAVELYGEFAWLNFPPPAPPTPPENSKPTDGVTR